MSRYIHALGRVPVHVGALTAWLRTRAKWLRLDVTRDAGGSHNVVLRVGEPYVSPDMAHEAARHFREASRIPIGSTPPVGPDDDEQDTPPKRQYKPRTTTKEKIRAHR